MPASNLVLYARWDPPTYTVNFELDGGSPAIEPQTVEKYKKVEKPANPEKEGYTFEGWFTEPEGGGDLFDWNTQIKSDTTIYAHWILKPLTYTVHYLRQEDNVELASDKVVTNPNLEVGEEVTEKALTIAGYRPDEGEKSLELALSGNEITFYYTLKTGTTGYKVFYYVEDTEIPVAEPKNVENVDGNTMSVIELAANVDYDMLYEEHPEYEGQEFFPTDVEKELILAADETKNVIVFYYSPYKSSKITVNFVDMDGNPVHDETTKTVKAGNTFTLARTPVSGWELDKAVEGTSYDGTAAGTTYKITESGVMVFTLFYKKKVTITANSFSRQYNGQPLTLPEDIGGQVTVTGLAQGDSLTSVTFSYVNTDVENGRRNVGTATVTPGNAAFANHGPDYYKVRYLSGTLEVTKVNVTVRIDPDRWTGNIYNGTVYKAGFTSPSKNVEDYITISNETYKTAHLDEIWEAVNSLVDYDASAPGLHYYAVAKTDAGDYSYDIGFTQAMLPVDNNYSVNLAVRSGRLQIRPKELTVTTGSNSKVYDGTPLTKDEATLDGLVEADQDKVTVSATGSQTPVGSSANSYEIAWGNVRSENYTITENLGTLEVTEAELSITIKDASKTYDGSSQKGYAPATVTGTGSTIETDEYTITGLAKGQKLTISGYTRPSGTDAGTYTNGSFDGAEITITDGEEDVTGYYTVSTTAGKLTITPKAVTVTAQDKEFTYNGTAQSWNKFEVDGLVGDDKITAVVTGSITFPSESPVTNELTSYEFTTGNPDNYTVTTADGELTMTNAEVEITITAASQGWTYDGAAHQNTEVKVTAGELLEGDTLVAEATGSVTNVADTDAGNNPIAAGYKIMHGEEDVTANYVIATENGTLTINPKAVTVTAQDKEFTYNGASQSWPKYDVEGLVGDDAITAVVTGSITFPSQSPVTNTIASYEFTTGTPGNYTVTKKDGELTMTKAAVEITITAADDEWTYDGEEHENLLVDVTGDLLPGDQLVASATGSVTNVADTADGNNPVAPGYRIMHDNEDVTANYVITTVAGTLTIKPRPVTVTAQDKAFAYDGQAHSWPEYDVDGLVGDDSIEAVVTGSITFPRQSPVTNKLESYVFIAGTPGNYSVTTENGELTMTNAEVEITITAASQGWTYDGAAHQNTEVKVTAGELLEGDTLVAEATGSVTNVADTAAGNNPIAAGYKIMHGEEDVTDNYAITAAPGTLTINPKAVTVTAQDKEFTYDGTAHSWLEYDVEGLVGEDAITAVVTGSITFPSQSPVTNTIASYEFTTGTPGNYAVTT